MLLFPSMCVVYALEVKDFHEAEELNFLPFILFLIGWLTRLDMILANVSSVNICYLLCRRANARNVSFKTLYGSQFTLSTQLIKQIVLKFSHRRSITVFLRNLPHKFWQSFVACLYIEPIVWNTHQSARCCCS